MASLRSAVLAQLEKLGSNTRTEIPVGVKGLWETVLDALARLVCPGAGGLWLDRGFSSPESRVYVIQSNTG